jgi:hypothetical protein
MRRGPFDSERDALARQRDKRLLRHSDFTTCPGVAGEAPDQKPERTLLRRFISETDNDHKTNLVDFSGLAMEAMPHLPTCPPSSDSRLCGRPIRLDLLQRDA